MPPLPPARAVPAPPEAAAPESIAPESTAPEPTATEPAASGIVVPFPGRARPALAVAAEVRRTAALLDARSRQLARAAGGMRASLARMADLHAALARQTARALRLADQAAQIEAAIETGQLDRLAALQAQLAAEADSDPPGLLTAQFSPIR